MSKFFNAFRTLFSTEAEDDVIAEETKISEVPKTNTSIRTSKVESSRPKPAYTAGPLSEMPRTATTSTVSSVKPNPFKAEKQSHAKFYQLEPKTVADSKMAIDYLQKGHAVILNLENLDNALCQRVVDVVSGALYLLDGTYKAITNDIYLMAPNGVEIKSPLEAEGVIESASEKPLSNNTFNFKK